MFRDPVQSTISHTETAINKIDPMGLIGLSVAAIVVLSVLAFALHIYYKFRRRNGNGDLALSLERRYEKNNDVLFNKVEKLNDKFDRIVIPLANDVAWIKGKLDEK